MELLEAPWSEFSALQLNPASFSLMIVEMRFHDELMEAQKEL